MKKSLKTRLDAANRTARWRETHPEHIDTRLVDRVLLESILVILTDGKTVPAAVSSRLLPAIVDAASCGLAERGHRGAPVTIAIGQRMRRHSEGHLVQRALRNRATLATPIPCVAE